MGECGLWCSMGECGLWCSMGECGLWCSVCSVQKAETVEGRVYRHSYHYINYELFVHVVKYKLDQMRKKIGAEERQVSGGCGGKGCMHALLKHSSLVLS